MPPGENVDRQTALKISLYRDQQRILATYRRLHLRIHVLYDQPGHQRAMERRTSTTPWERTRLIPVILISPINIPWNNGQLRRQGGSVHGEGEGGGARARAREIE